MDAHLRTDGVTGDLARRTAVSSAQRIGAQAVQLVIAIGTTMVLARLLTPADFGLVAMVTVVAAFVGSFRDLGLPAAAIHREGLDQPAVSALFWLGLRWNLAIAVAVAALGPLLARFYGEAELVAITLAMSGVIFVSSVSVQHEALLSRQLRYDRLTAIQLGSIVTGAVAGIAGALLGLGYWALVLQLAATTAVKSASLWLACRWRPDPPSWRLGPGDPAFREMVSYGADVTGYRVLAHVGRNLDQVLVGYVGGAAALGLYEKAYKWSVFPVKQLYTPLMGVAVSSLSRVRGNPAAYRAHCTRILLPFFAVVFPVLALLFLEARGVILVLLGGQWLDAVPLFRILLIGAYVGSAGMITKWLYLSEGRTRRQLRWGLVSTPVMIAAVALGAFWGATGVAVGFTLGTCLTTPTGLAYCLRGSHLGGRGFLRIVWRPVVMSLVPALALAPLLASGLLDLPPLGRLLVSGAAFAVLSVGVWLVLPGGRRDLRAVVALLRLLVPRARVAAESAAN